MELMTVSTSNCEKRICVSMCMWGVGEEGGGGGERVGVKRDIKYLVQSLARSIFSRMLTMMINDSILPCF